MTDDTRSSEDRLRVRPEWLATIDDTVTLLNGMGRYGIVRRLVRLRTALAASRPAPDTRTEALRLPCGACQHPFHEDGRQCAVPSLDGFPCQCYFPMEQLIR